MVGSNGVGFLRFARLVTVLVASAWLTACGSDDSGAEAAPTSSTGGNTVTAPTTTPSASVDTSTPTDTGSTPDVVEAPAAPLAPVEENAAPSIAGAAPASVTVGETFTFQPVVQDPDGDALEFTVSSKPDWAKFDSKTGKLSGTPTTSEVGSYEEISIAVTDGTTTTTLPEFSVTVVDEGASLGNATLSWEAPTSNTDGTALTNLKGFKIHYGPASGTYTTTVTVDNPSLSRYVVEDLAEGTWYFSVTAYTTTGVESQFSVEATKTIS